MKQGLYLIAALLISPNALAWECKPSAAFQCEGGTCVTSTTNIRINVDSSKSTVFRCDSKGCDPIEVKMYSSGVMTTFVNGEGGYVLRINSTDGSFVEVASLMTTALIKQGKCAK